MPLSVTRNFMSDKVVIVMTHGITAFLPQPCRSQSRGIWAQGVTSSPLLGIDTWLKIQEPGLRSALRRFESLVPFWSCL